MKIFNILGFIVFVLAIIAIVLGLFLTMSIGIQMAMSPELWQVAAHPNMRTQLIGWFLSIGSFGGIAGVLYSLLFTRNTNNNNHA